MTKACLAAFFERQVQPVESVESDRGKIFCDASILSNYYAHHVLNCLRPRASPAESSRTKAEPQSPEFDQNAFTNFAKVLYLISVNSTCSTSL